jgi:drug/metabolite transporter (DMT)-like permease
VPPPLTLRQFLVVIAALVIVQLNWSALTVSLKRVLNHTPAVIFCAYRDAIAVVCLLAAATWREQCARPLLRRSDWRHVLFLCLCGVLMFTNQLFNILGILLSTPSMSPMTQPLIPAWTFALATILKLDQSAQLRKLLESRQREARERISAGKEWTHLRRLDRVLLWCHARLPLLRLCGFAGVLVSALGAGLMVLANSQSTTTPQRNPLLGMLMFALNTFSMALSIIVQKVAYNMRPKSMRLPVTGVDIDVAVDPLSKGHSRTDDNVVSPNRSFSPPSSLLEGDEVRLRLLTSDAASPFPSEAARGTGAAAINGTQVDGAMEPGSSLNGDGDDGRLHLSSVASLSEWQRYPISLTAYGYVVCLVCMLLCSTYYIPPSIASGDWRSNFVPPLSAVGPLLFGGVCASALNFALLTWATSRVPPAVVTATWPLQIPVVSVACWLLYGDAMSTLQLAGATVLCAGMAVLVAVNLNTYKLEKEATAMATAAAAAAIGHEAACGDNQDGASLAVNRAPHAHAKA